MKRAIIASFISLVLTMPLAANPYEVFADGYTWAYDYFFYYGICNWHYDDMLIEQYERAISPEPEGALTIPSSFDIPWIEEDEVVVRSIGPKAFYGCSGLTSVTIPDSVVSIHDRAFSGCSGLTNVTIPDSVTCIDSSAFNDCSGLVSISVGDGNTEYSSCNGLLLTKDGGELIQGVGGDVVMPDGVVSIGDYAFFGRTGLTSVMIPNSVTNIGNRAFENCSNLTSVTIPDGVTSIGYSAFLGCSGLVSISVGDGNTEYSSSNGLLLTKDGGELIQGVGGDVAIPDGVVSIGGYAFFGHTGLTSVMIPDSVTNIGNRAFENCSNLTSVTIPARTDLISHCAFNYCTGLTNIVFEGDAPVLENSTVFHAVPSDCKVYVRRGTAGWNVAIPGTWNGLQIEYIDEDIQVRGYEITFDDDGGKGGWSSVLEYGAPLVPPTVTKPGLVFNGWSPVPPATVPASNAMYKALWTPIGGRMGAFVTGGSGSWKQSDAGWRCELPSDISGAPFRLTWLKTTVVGPGDVSFRWSAPSSIGVSVYLDDERIAGGMSDVASEEVSTSVRIAGPGTHALTLEFDESCESIYRVWDDIDADYYFPDSWIIVEDIVVPDHGESDNEVVDHGESDNEVVKPWTANKLSTLNGAVYESDGTLAGVVQLKVSKPNTRRGTAKVSGYVMLIGGNKSLLKPATVAVGRTEPLSVETTVRDLGAVTAKIGDDGFSGVIGGRYTFHAADIGGSWTRNDAKVYVDFKGGGLPSNTFEMMLPDGEPVTAKAGRWSFAKAALVRWTKDRSTGGFTLTVNTSAGKTNLSSMRLAYTPKTGIFKGTFKIYAIVNNRLKKYSVSVLGMVVNGRGVGTATLKGVSPWPVTVE